MWSSSMLGIEQFPCLAAIKLGGSFSRARRTRCGKKLHADKVPERLVFRQVVEPCCGCAARGVGEAEILVLLGTRELVQRIRLGGEPQPCERGGRLGTEEVGDQLRFLEREQLPVGGR